jgi:endonuclease YncB( thermonuclease family)
MKRVFRWSRWSGLALAWVLASGACADSARRGVQRYGVDQLEASLAQPETLGLDMGVFPLKQGAIVDGDTVKVGGLEESLRLIGLDTEETFKSEKNKREYEEGWATYWAKKSEGKSRPIKIATPMGEEAKHFAEDFFKGVRRVKLERDHPKEVRGRYNRFLAYVFAERDGEWVNYNIEAVRAGMTPYFTKYAYSRRFHDEFVAAQEEARAAKRGIWSDAEGHYPDYPRRLEWWNSRADFIAEFEREAEGRDDMIVLTHSDAPQRLAGLLDREVEVLATVGDIKPRKGKAPARVMLSRRLFADMPLIFWDEEVLAQSGIEAYKGEFVRVKGLVTAYTNKYTQETVLQIEVRMPRQVGLPPYDPPGREASTPKTDTASADDGAKAPAPERETEPTDAAEPTDPTETSENQEDA